MMLELKMNLLLFALLPFTFACPYSKFSPDHSYCKPRNPQCRIFDAGFNEKEKQLIVKLHNDYRNKIALGQERRAGGMPPASNMLEMVWDDELAVIAQKWAEQCIFEHDCDDCRKVDRFSVGQNIFKSPTKGKFQMNSKGKEKELRSAITGFYEEIRFFNKNLVRKFVFDEKWGHFSQVIWAETWHLGCGKVYFDEGTGQSFILVCNYGPPGNYEGAAIYKSGQPCSACPKDACCGDACRKHGVVANYKKLCKKVKGSRASPSKDYGSNPSYDYGSNPSYDYGSNPSYDYGSNPSYDYGSNHPAYDYGNNPSYNYGSNPSYYYSY